jgi:two-component system sensor histidine kinase/response regulator
MDPILTKQFNILVVDDNPKNIQVIGNILKDANYFIGFATSGEQAIEILQKTYDYDLVLLDVNMPSMNGYETCIAIRKNETLKEMPIIFLTAYTDADNVIAGFESGAQDYITKPFNSKELLARVETHLQLKHKSDLIKKMNQELDVTVKERTIELEKAYHDLIDLDSIKTDFLLFISQEIRTPLNGIAGTINLIKNQEFSSTMKSLVEMLETSVSKLEEFTYKALFFNQLSQGKYPLQTAQINLKDLIQFSILELTNKITEKNIEVVKRGFQTDIFINADRDLLFKAFLYIIDNAVKFSPPNGNITLELTIEDQSVSLTCTDSGEGFPPEVLEKLLMPFRFLNDENHQKSLLSLGTVKQIMNMHAGKLNISNQEKKGARVELIFAKK